jgi:putative peptidoglycan lipid II flippase
LRRTLGAVAFMMVPSALGLVVAGFPIVQTLYQRGNFDLEAARRTAWALALYAAGLPAHGALEILARSFYALQDTRTPVAAGVAAMAANVVLATALVGPLGFLGVPLALSLSTTAEAALLALVLARRLPGLFAADLAASLGCTAVASAALAAAAAAGVALTRDAALPPAIQTAAALAAGGAAYAGGAYALRSPDLMAVATMARRRLGR